MGQLYERQHNSPGVMCSFSGFFSSFFTTFIVFLQTFFWIFFHIFLPRELKKNPLPRECTARRSAGGHLDDGIRASKKSRASKQQHSVASPKPKAKCTDIK
jgi:hypothetical protein